MYNKLSPFISLGLRRFPPSALQQVLVWRGLSDGISAGCVVGINDLLKAICPPKVTHMHTRARVPQPYAHPDSSHNDRTNYNILCGLGVCECVSVLFEAVSLLVMERDSLLTWCPVFFFFFFFFVQALQELRWSVSVCVAEQKITQWNGLNRLHYIICKVGLVFAVLQTQSWDLTSCLCWPTLHGNPLCAGLDHIDLSSS